MTMKHTTEVKIFESTQKVYDAIAKSIQKLTRNPKQDVFNIALSGGNSPKGLFKLISQKYADQIPWKRIHLWWVDERCVAPDNEQSNYNMTREYLLSHISIPDGNIHRIRGEKPPTDEAKRYSGEINKLLNNRSNNPVFDLIILGMGDDGHTASIFPDQMELFGYPDNCAVAQQPQTGQKRITITGNVLNNANHIFFLVTGKNKATRIYEIMNNNEAAKLLPAYHIAPENGNLIWFLDEEAASLIS